MKFKYLVISGGDIIWGKQEITKDYFVSAIRRGDTIVNLKQNTVFDAENNKWEDIKGDE